MIKIKICRARWLPSAAVFLYEMQYLSPASLASGKSIIAGFKEFSGEISKSDDKDYRTLIS